MSTEEKLFDEFGNDLWESDWDDEEIDDEEYYNADFDDL
jgi:hypothetical protein